MTQAEQAMLRYNYLMSATAQQQGDYARTINSFANQWRLLTLNVQQFSATVGQGLIAAVLPALQALNALMSVLQRAAEAFRDFMYVLTGYKPQSSGGIVNDLAGIGDTASDLGDLGSAGDTAAGGLDDATSAAEDLKKALSVLSFDELNQLSDTSVPDASTPSGGSGGGGAGGLGGGSGLGGLDSITDALGKSELPEAINEWAERIRDAFLDHDWDKLGEEIAWGINKGMQAIYDAIRWENVGPKITKFINAFTTAFNSLVDNINFDLIGRTVGAGINTIVRSFNLLVGEGGIDFNNIGKKLSDGLRGAINEISWRELGNALGNGFMIAWDIFSGFIFQMSQKNDLGITGWEELGKSLGKAVKGLFEKIDFDTIAMVFADGFNGVFEVIKNFNAEKSFEGLGEKISKALNHAIGTIKADEAGKALSDFVISLLDELLYVAENTNWELFGKKVGEFLGNIDWIGILTRVIKIISEVLGGLFNGLESSGLAGSIASWIAKAFILVKVGKPVLGLINTIGKIITGNSSFSILSKAFKTVFGSSASEAAAGISGIGNAAEGAAKGGIGKLLSVTGKILPIFAGATTAAWAGTEAVKALNKDNVKTAESTQTLSDTLMTLKDSGDITSKQWEQLYTVMTNGQAAGKNSSQIFEDVAKKMSELGISTDTAKLAIESAGGSFEQLSSKVNTAKEDINSTNFTGLISQLDATKNSVERIDFSQLALNAASAIDQAKGIWIQGMDGWSQVTGEKALEIYQGIKNGLYPENGQGYYDIGNGVVASFGNGITEGTEGVKATLDSAFIQTLQTKLPEGYTIAYQNGQFTIQKYTQGLIDNSGNVSNALNNSTIAKINEILPQGNILSYQNGQWTIQKYAEGINSGEEQANIALSDATIKQIEELLPVGYEIFYNGGTNSIQSFADGITSKKTLVEQTNKSVLIDSNEGLDSKLKEKYSGYAALSAQGYNQKLSELKGETQREVESFATNSIINPFANILKINSPSRVFREFGEYSVEGFEEGFEKKKGDAENIVNNLGRNLQKSMSGFLDSIDKGVRSSEKQITSRFSSIQRSASTVASDIVRAFSNLHIPLPHLSWDWNYIDFGDFSFSIPSFKIRWYAKGGLFTKATLAGIGEAGKEAVLPLENRRTMSMIADSIMENGNIGVDEETLANAVAQGVAMAMMNNQGNQTPITVYAELKTESDEVLARAVTRGQQKIDYRNNPTIRFGY